MRWRSPCLWALASAGCLACTGSERTIFSELAPAAVVQDPAASDGGTDRAGPSSGIGSAVSGMLPEELRADASFDWPQTLPGAGGCEPGTYAGKFECMLGLFPLSGALRFTLDRADEAEVLEIVSGEMVGLDAGGLELLRGDLAGTLRCAERKLDAHAVDGRTLSTFPLLPVPLFNGFDATLDGTFDPDVLRIEGAWRMSNVTSGLLCEGQFTVSWSP